jgi:subtilisin family serine protease
MVSALLPASTGERREEQTMLSRLTVTLAVTGVLMVAGTIVGSPAAAAPEAAILYAGAPGAIPDSYLVAFKERLSRSTVDARVNDLATRYDATVTRTYRSALSGFAATMTEQQARRLAADPSVSYVEQNRTLQLQADQNNPPSWGIDRIDQRNYPPDGTYNYEVTASAVRAYVIDTGIRISHNDFGGRASYGRDVYDDDGNASDCHGHGTHVAGTIGGAAHGVAKGVRLVAVRAAGCTGASSVEILVDGIEWVTDNHVKPAVANVSMGGAASQLIDDAVRGSIDAGVTYVVSAGNLDSNACQQSPARVGPAITAGATDRLDRRADFSNFGGCLDLFAPGVDIRSALHTSNTATGTKSGTSMAAPHVTGAAAMHLARNPSATPAQVRTALVDYATPNEVSNPGTNSPNRLLYRVKNPTVTFLSCRSDPPQSMSCSTGHRCGTTPVTIRWYQNGTHVPRWDNRLSIADLCFTPSVTIQVRLTAGNGTDRATDSFICEFNG